MFGAVALQKTPLDRKKALFARGCRRRIDASTTMFAIRSKRTPHGALRCRRRECVVHVLAASDIALRAIRRAGREAYHDSSIVIRLKPSIASASRRSRLLDRTLDRRHFRLITWEIMALNIANACLAREL
ncbi:hypothetical protein [Lysobacter enzymogenes]|uniref:hypothetical protein n=1 Tax=Lysobacter enzymogenes TaxID=69 RepID=UPI001F529235|nr:hypothetical protein [Lysobacter enzymogenes]UZW63454.1 hypothetical protein BV903_006430 [Lysobacter enzymogenes]